MFKVLMCECYCREFFSSNYPYIPSTEDFGCSCPHETRHEHFVLARENHQFIAYVNRD